MRGPTARSRDATAPREPRPRDHRQERSPRARAVDGWFGQRPPAIRQHVGVRAQTALVRSRGSYVPKPARAEAFTASINQHVRVRAQTALVRTWSSYVNRNPPGQKRLQDPSVGRAEHPQGRPLPTQRVLPPPLTIPVASESGAAPFPCFLGVSLSRTLTA